MLDFRTDLADERTDLYKKANNIENNLPFSFKLCF